MIGGFIGHPIGGVINTSSVATVSLSARAGSMVFARTAGSFSTAVTAAAKAQVACRVQAGMVLYGRIGTEFTARVQGGYALPGRVNVKFDMRAPGGVNLPARNTAMVRMRAPGGVAMPGRITATTKLKAPGGVAIPGLCRASFTMRAPGGFSLKGKAVLGFKLLSTLAVSGEVTVTRLPLYRRGSTYWKGRS